MVDFLQSLGVDAWITTERIVSGGRALLVLLIGLPLARLVAGGLGRAVQARTNRQNGMMSQRLTSWLLISLLLLTALHELGFHLGVMLGAAGVLTVAVGFASQTSASNLISGLFLMFERPFVVGDVIEIEGRKGEVLSIDLLSVKLRTFDNLLVRIPNEDIFKRHIVNLSHYPIRRVDIVVGVGYSEELGRVREVLMSVAEENPLCMTEPEPLLIFQGYGDSGVQFKFAVWGARENYLVLLNSMSTGIKQALDAAGIEIPFPHRTLYTGKHTSPMPVQLVERSEEA